ncbi:hypothetical protein ACFFX0_15775 [Citricoccus parietis]|uniref:Uncharacterized protein n=1 Tax=Citricoccus parietis TaxID=592307 RepID=A0ABV5G0W9_9MICC
MIAHRGAGLSHQEWQSGTSQRAHHHHSRSPHESAVFRITRAPRPPPIPAAHGCRPGHAGRPGAGRLGLWRQGGRDGGRRCGIRQRRQRHQLRGHQRGQHQGRFHQLTLRHHGHQ